MHLKLLQEEQFKKVTGDLTGNKIAGEIAKSDDDKITKVSKAAPQNNSETVINE